MALRREIKIEAFLANLPLFKGLGAEELARLAAGTRRRKLVRGETLFRQGEPSNGLFAVVYGKIQLSAGERIADIVGPGSASSPGCCAARAATAPASSSSRCPPRRARSPRAST